MYWLLTKNKSVVPNYSIKRFWGTQKKKKRIEKRKKNYFLLFLLSYTQKLVQLSSSFFCCCFFSMFVQKHDPNWIQSAFKCSALLLYFYASFHRSAMLNYLKWKKNVNGSFNDFSNHLFCVCQGMKLKCLDENIICIYLHKEITLVCVRSFRKEKFFLEKVGFHWFQRNSE